MSLGAWGKTTRSQTRLQLWGRANPPPSSLSSLRGSKERCGQAGFRSASVQVLKHMERWCVSGGGRRLLVRKLQEHTHTNTQQCAVSSTRIPSDTHTHLSHSLTHTVSHTHTHTLSLSLSRSLSVCVCVQARWHYLWSCVSFEAEWPRATPCSRGP